MIEGSLIAKENGIGSILIGSNFVNTVLYNFLRVQKYSMSDIFCSVQYTITLVFPYLNTVVWFVGS